MKFNTFYLLNLVLLQKKYGNKWFDECLKSFGAYFFLQYVFNQDTKVIHSFTDLASKDFSKEKKRLKEQAIIAEEIIRKSECRESAYSIFSSFISLFNGEPNTFYNKSKFPPNERVKSKQGEFNEGR